jgi:hypothetical protein
MTLQERLRAHAKDTAVGLGQVNWPAIFVEAAGALDAKDQAYELSERENTNLRATLEWLLSRAILGWNDPNRVLKEDMSLQKERHDADLAEFGRRLNATDGTGVVKDGAEEDAEAAVELGALIGRAAAHLEAASRIRLMVPDKYIAEADAIATALRAHEQPRKPIVLTAREMAEREAKVSVHRRK